MYCKFIKKTGSNVVTHRMYPWSVVSCQWSVVSGQLLVVSGQLLVVNYLSHFREQKLKLVLY
jgi:hypothetical protein